MDFCKPPNIHYKCETFSIPAVDLLSLFFHFVSHSLDFYTIFIHLPSPSIYPSFLLSSPKMEIVILAAAFIGANIWGIFGPVPFTNINPAHTFLERFLGSVQLTSTIYALQEVHPLVFPEVLLEEPWRSKRGKPPAETIEVLKTVTDYLTQNITGYVTDYVTVWTTPDVTPTNKTQQEELAKSTSLAPIWDGYGYPDPGSAFPPFSEYYSAVPYAVAIVLVSFIVLFNLRRLFEKMKAKKPKTVEFDAATFEQLVGALKQEFQHRVAAQGPENESVDSVTRRSNIAGILDLVKIPSRSQLENDPPTIDALIDVSQRVTRVEELMKMVFPYTGRPAADGSGNAAPTGPETRFQPAEQEGAMTYKEEFDKKLKDIDDGMKNYTRLADELESVKEEMQNEANTQEMLRNDIKAVRDELSSLYSAMMPIDGDARDLSDIEKTDLHHYTDAKVSQSNIVLHAKYNELAERLDSRANTRLTEYTTKADVAALDRRMNDGFSFVYHRTNETRRMINDLQVTPSGRLFNRQQLSSLVSGVITDDPTIQEMLKRYKAITKAALEDRAMLRQLSEKIDSVHGTTAFLAAENAKAWDSINAAGSTHSSDECTGFNGESYGEPLFEDLQPTHSPVLSDLASSPTTSPKGKIWKGKEPMHQAFNDNDSDMDSTKSPETVITSIWRGRTASPRPAAPTPAAPATDEVEAKPQSTSASGQGYREPSRKPRVRFPPENQEPLLDDASTGAFDFFTATNRDIGGGGSYQSSPEQEAQRPASPAQPQEPEQPLKLDDVKVDKGKTDDQQAEHPPAAAASVEQEIPTTVNPSTVENSAKQHGKSDSPREKEQADTVPQGAPTHPSPLEKEQPSATTPQGTPIYTAFNPTRYGHAEHMEKLESQPSAAVKKEEHPKQHTQSSKLQEQKQTSTAPQGSPKPPSPRDKEQPATAPQGTSVYPPVDPTGYGHATHIEKLESQPPVAVRKENHPKQHTPPGKLQEKQQQSTAPQGSPKPPPSGPTKGLETARSQPPAPATKDDTPKQDTQSDKPQETEKTQSAPQTGTAPQMAPKPPMLPFDPSQYGGKEFMKRVNTQPRVLAAGRSSPPKQQPQSDTLQGQRSSIHDNPWQAAREGLKPPSQLSDPSKCGPKPLANIPTYPPAGTKRDYQPRTPNKPGPGQKKGAQGKGQQVRRDPMGPPPPAREAATGEEQRQLQGWNTFGTRALDREREEDTRLLEQSKNVGSLKTLDWKPSVTWKPRRVPPGLSAPDSGRRSSEPVAGARAGEAQTEAERGKSQAAAGGEEPRTRLPGLATSMHARPGDIVKIGDEQFEVPSRRGSAS